MSLRRERRRRPRAKKAVEVTRVRGERQSSRLIKPKLMREKAAKDWR